MGVSVGLLQTRVLVRHSFIVQVDSAFGMELQFIKLLKLWPGAADD